MEKHQVNIRLSHHGIELLNALIGHFSQKNSDTGRRATQAEVVERGLRALAAREKLRELA